MISSTVNLNVQVIHLMTFLYNQWKKNNYDINSTSWFKIIKRYEKVWE